MRFRQIIIIFRVLFVILSFGLFYAQVIKGNYFYRQSEKNTIRVIPQEAARGRILDRNGVALADSIASYNISVIPQEIQDPEIIFSKLSKLLGVSIEKIKANYKKRYLSPFVPVRILENLGKEKIIIVEENKLQLPGVVIEIQPRRNYPFGRLASHVLGYLGKLDIWKVTKLKPYGYESTDLIGYSGIEERYDLVLKGQRGGEQIEVDNRGQRVRTVGYRPPEQGQDITITIDIRAQKIVDEFMQGKKGAAVIMDPNSGEIIALSSQPNYDPNDFARRNDTVINDLLNSEDYVLFNRAISGKFPPGSVFKVVTSIAALERDESLANKTFTCSGNMQIGNRSYSCSSKHNIEDLRQAVIRSCNIYFYNLGIFIGPELIDKYAFMLGLGRPTEIDLNYETKGFIPTPNWKKLIRFQNWYNGDTANISIGQGDILASPIQMVRLFSVFINEGKLVRPHLIKLVGTRKVNMSKDKIISLNKNILAKLSSYLYSVINDPEGTASLAKSEVLKIFGKTGTAQVSGKPAHGWLAGYVGKDKPRYAFCIFLENAGSSSMACTVAKNIFEEMLKEELI